MSAEILTFPRARTVIALAEARPGDPVLTGTGRGIVERRVRAVAGDILYVRMTGGDFPGAVRAVRVAWDESPPAA